MKPNYAFVDSKVGNVLIPDVFLNALRMNDGDSFSIELDSYRGSIIISKMGDNCVFCRTGLNLIGLSGKFICSECREKIIQVDVGSCVF